MVKLIANIAYGRSLVKTVLLVFAAAILVWFIVGDYLHARRGRGVDKALEYVCAENTRALASLYQEYTRAHGSAPMDLQDLATMATNQTWIFNCAFVADQRLERIPATTARSQPTEGRAAYPVTYLYFTNAVSGVKIVCPVWHQGLVGVNSTGAVVSIDRATWKRIGESLAAEATGK